MIREFYAVTTASLGSSLYKVSGQRDGKKTLAVATKIALRGESSVGVGGKFSSDMIAVCRNLIAYIPKNGLFGFREQQIENVKTRNWGGRTSRIVALFLDSETAAICFGEDEHIQYDPRWRVDTKAVIEAIGNQNPFFSVGLAPEFRLIM